MMRQFLLAATAALVGMAGTAGADTVLRYEISGTLITISDTLDTSEIAIACFPYDEDGLPCPFPGPPPFPSAFEGQTITGQLAIEFIDGAPNVIQCRLSGYMCPLYLSSANEITGAVHLWGADTLDAIPELSLGGGTGSYAILGAEWMNSSGSIFGSRSLYFDLSYTVAGLVSPVTTAVPLPAGLVLLPGALALLVARRRRAANEAVLKPSNPSRRRGSPFNKRSMIA